MESGYCRYHLTGSLKRQSPSHTPKQLLKEAETFCAPSGVAAVVVHFSGRVTLTQQIRV
jgi:hypothetical protein